MDAKKTLGEYKIKVEPELEAFIQRVISENEKTDKNIADAMKHARKITSSRDTPPTSITATTMATVARVNEAPIRAGKACSPGIESIETHLPYPSGSHFYSFVSSLRGRCRLAAPHDAGSPALV